MASAPAAIQGPEAMLKEWEALVTRLKSLPEPVQDMADRGLRKVVNFQDSRYGDEYLDRLEKIAGGDQAEQGFGFTREAAKYIANAMAYDDVIRVADLKTRTARFERIREEMNAGERLLHLTEFMHPRAEEITGIMPAWLGGFIEKRAGMMKLIDRLFNRGRRVRTLGARGFLTLYLISGLRGRRRRSLRHRHELAHLESWLERCLAARAKDYELGMELLRCRRLVKGYSDTHARGLSKFDRVMEGAALVEGRPDAAEWVARLRELALKDEKGTGIEGALQTIRSFA